MRHWLFPRQGIVNLTVPPSVIAEIGAGDLVYWLEDSGGVAFWGEVLALEPPPPAGPPASVRLTCEPARTRVSAARLEDLIGGPLPGEMQPLPAAAAELESIVRRKTRRWLQALPDLLDAAREKLPDLEKISRDLTGRVLQQMPWRTKEVEPAEPEEPETGEPTAGPAAQPADAGPGERPDAAPARAAGGAAAAPPRRPAGWLVPAGRPTEQRVSKSLYEHLEPGDRVLWQEASGAVESWGTVLALRPVWRAPERQRRVLVTRLPLDASIPIGEPGESQERPLSEEEIARLRSHATSIPRSFEEAFWEELDTIRELRERRGYEVRATAGAPRRRLAEQVVYHKSHRMRLAGLAFSGGGIRSATFNLGVLQALAARGLLPAFDYLSTVSGGGYIGSWLVAWIKRRGLAEVLGRLRSEHPPLARDRHLAGQRPPRLTPITFLRGYSNFLTPRLGILGADSWTVVATYTRNLLLNLLILIAALAALLVVPRAVVELSELFRRPGGQLWSFTIAVAAALVGMYLLMRNILALSVFLEQGGDGPSASSRRQRLLGYGQVLVVPLFLSAWAGSCWTWLLQAREGVVASGRFIWLEAIQIWARPTLELLAGVPAWMRWSLAAGALYTVLWLPVVLTNLRGLVRYLWRESRWRSWDPKTRSDASRRSLKIFLLWGTAFAAGIGGGLLLWWSSDVIYRLSSRIAAREASATAFFRGLQGGPPEIAEAPGFALQILWGPPAVVLVIAATAALHLGLMGRGLSEDHRQWWSRLGAWMLIASATWIGLFGVAIFGSVALAWIGERGAAALSTVSLSWVASTLAGLWAARSSDTGEGGGGRQELIAKVAPYVFIAGLLALLAGAIQATIVAILSSADLEAPNLLRLHLAATWEHPSEHQIWALPVSAGALALFAVALSLRIDLNEFSMHLFYRNRLVRAYLGASRERHPHPFTGFDPHDDLALGSLLDTPGAAADTDGEAHAEPIYDGPFPILNTALNLAGGSDLVQQQRKATSFFFTPLHYGFDTAIEPATEPDRSRLLPASEPFAVRYTAAAQGGEGISLGTAMTVSGAAVNPNMGYHSSAPLAFLMTVFNARLGLWLGNPRRNQTWSMAGPRFGLVYLLFELFGYTTARSGYVSLSDGGHFDNLGIYELVRRRCRYIVACDAEADPELGFGGLSNAIRKCRSDFGVDIEIDAEPILADARTKLSRWHGVVGKIHYPDESASPGVLVYLKASMTGNEPEDVIGYRKRHASFPHESTGDQWFDESQFESYRALGRHAADELFGAADIEGARRRHGGSVSLERVFVDLRHAWYKPSQAIAQSFTRHSSMLVEIFERLRSEESLAFLVPQVYVELRDWRGGRPAVDRPRRRDARGRFALAAPQSPTDLTPTELRQGFFLCNTVIQLMENVYLDLALEGEWDHPDNRGWMNLFHHWSWSWMFRTTWAISAATYGARFQRFCERRLRIPPGRLHAVEIPGPPYDSPPAALSRLELNLAQRIEAACGFDGRRRPLTLPLRLQVLAPRSSHLDELPGADPAAGDGAGDVHFQFTFGFAVLAEVSRHGEGPRERNLIFLRVRDHLRKLGLGRRALRHMMGHHRLVPAPGYPPDEQIEQVLPGFRRGPIQDLIESAWTESLLEQPAEAPGPPG